MKRYIFIGGIMTRYEVREITETLRKIMNDPAQKKEFLEFCHMYDSSPYVCGMGKDNLFAKGDKL